jgi:hypothetical protein
MVLRELTAFSLPPGSPFGKLRDFGKLTDLPHGGLRFGLWGD